MLFTNRTQNQRTTRAAQKLPDPAQPIQIAVSILRKVKTKLRESIQKLSLSSRRKPQMVDGDTPPTRRALDLSIRQREQWAREIGYRQGQLAYIAQNHDPQPPKAIGKNLGAWEDGLEEGWADEQAREYNEKSDWDYNIRCITEHQKVN